MALGLFEQLAWLTDKVKKLCCAIEQILPSQEGQSGKYLKTDGNTTSWESISNELPTQVLADAGEFLQADGSGGVSYQPVLPYKVYSAILNQTGTNAPVEAFVLQNTIGPITWQYLSTGNYRTTSLGTYGKVFALIGGSPGSQRIVSVYLNIFGGVEIITSSTTGVVNGYLSNTPIEIRVYN